MDRDEKIKIQRKPSYLGEDLLLLIGVAVDEVDEGGQLEILTRYWAERAGRGESLEAFGDRMKGEDPEFHREVFAPNFPRQDAYLAGELRHEEEPPSAWMESLFVKPRFRGRGYARRLISRFLEEADGHCYPTHGKVDANEKPDDFRWRLGEGGRTSSPNYPAELEPAEFNERQERLLDLYDDFGFEVVRSAEDPERRRYYWISRGAQCSLEG
jgi:GNAT superfamily N-acetyltransferase